MVSVNEAIQILAQQVIKMPSIDVLVSRSLNHVLSADVKSKIDVPPFHNSAMDGYAFLFQPEKKTFQVSQYIQAGDYSDKTILPENAARIFTGAALPKGCDTVIQQELCTVNNGIVSFDNSKIKQGQNIRLRGSQNKNNDIIAKTGSIIRPGSIGLFASVGVTSVSVYDIPSVGVIVTGNELQQIGTTLQPGHIYNSNEPALLALLENIGIKKYDTCWVRDEKELLQKKINEYLEQHHVLILSGGISAGDYDIVRETLLHAGVEELFYKVKQKPGKPLFAGKKDNKLIFALPGNPAAVITCFYRYVKPSLLSMMGYENTFLPNGIMPIANDLSVKKGLTYFMKAHKINNQLAVLPGQDSFNLLPFAEADCLITIDESIEFVPANSLVEVYNL